MIEHKDDNPSMNLDEFIGCSVAMQLLQPLMMMIPSREDPPRPVPAIQGDKPMLMLHMEGTLLGSQPRTAEGFVFHKQAQEVVAELSARSEISESHAARLVDRLYDLLLAAYNRGVKGAGRTGTYRMKWLANNRYMETQVNPAAVYAVTRCTDETVAPIHRVESSLIVPG